MRPGNVHRRHGDKKRLQRDNLTMEKIAKPLTSKDIFNIRADLQMMIGTAQYARYRRSTQDVAKSFQTPKLINKFRL